MINTIEKIMAKKDFAFLFYVNDWAGGTQWMSRLQRGGYLDLLLYQVNNTSFTLDEAKLILGEDFDKIWYSVEKKLVFEGGKYFNKKMKEVLDARKSFTESRRNNRLSKQVLNTSDTLVEQVEKEKEKEKGSVLGVVKIDKGLKGKRIKGKPHLFIDSPFYFTSEFEKAFENDDKYNIFDIKFYYEAVKNWSANGNVRIDWIATARTFMLKDLNKKQPQLKHQYSKQFYNGKSNNRPETPQELLERTMQLDRERKGNTSTSPDAL